MDSVESTRQAIGMNAERRRHGRRTTTYLAAAATLCLLASFSRLSSAFIGSASTRRQSLPPRHRPAAPFRESEMKRNERNIQLMAGKGFGKRLPEAEPKTSSEDSPSRTVSGSGLVSWEKEYKAYIKRTGRYLCSMSWEGHQEMGRGAIFANYDDARAGGKLDDAEKFGGIPSMYIPLKEFEGMRAADGPDEEDDLAQIVQRINTYRPEAEFVVVFQAAGVMGTDIVRPNVPPPEMAKHVVTQAEKASATEVSASADGVIDVTVVEE